MTDREWAAVDALAQGEWDNFKQRIKAWCRELQKSESAVFNYEETDGSLTIRRSSFKVLRVQFQPQVPRIMWECETEVKVKGWITFRLLDGVVSYISEGEPVDVNAVVRSLMVCLKA